MTGCQSNQNDQASSKASTQAISEVAKSSVLIELTDSDKEITKKKKSLTNQENHYWQF